MIAALLRRSGSVALPILAAMLATLAAPCLTPAAGEPAVSLNIFGNNGPTAADISPAAKALHQRLTIVDLHSDALLWGRDLTRRSSRGQVDLPRLAEGNVALQVFSVVTKTPLGQNIESNSGKTDAVQLLAIAGHWPRPTWSSLKQRALYQAGRLWWMASASKGRFVIVRSAHELRSFLQRRKREPGLVGGLLSIEGAHALDGDPDNLGAMYDAGFRMMSMAHFFDNEFGGSAHGVNKGGLTPLGRDLVKRMEAKRMIVDLAHASDKQIDDVLAMAKRPVVDTHTGVKGTCNNRRNLSDDQLKRIAATGGLVGIGFWETATCGRDAQAIARAIKYTANLIGIDHVTLGSDFDGAVRTPFDAAGMVALTDALMKAGFSEKDIAKVMGGNAIRFLLGNLPA
jgi:membrane dipeptidase